MSRKETETINQFIIRSVKDKQPETVEQLVHIIQKKFSLSEEEAMKHIIDLNNNRKLILKDQTFSSTCKDYVFSIKATWYWATIIIATATTVSVFVIPENAFPMVHARYLLGSIFVLFLPGFCLLKALFPRKELDNIERAALSIGTSLAIVPLTSFLLNYTAWGITTPTVIFSLLGLTITFASVALLQEFQMQKP